jgi:hypothetical protein
MNQPYNAVFNSVPAANALRRVEGFNPLKFLRRLRSEQTGAEVLKLELPYQKLWFRLAFPNGRMVLNNLRITDQLAIFEAIVFSDKGDSEPLSRITATATRSETPNGQYIQAAQDKALSEALENAGFGIQFCDIAEGAGRSDYGSTAAAVQPRSEDDDLPFTMKSAEPEQDKQHESAVQPMSQTAPVMQNPVQPVQQEQPTVAVSQPQSAAVAEPAAAQNIAPQTPTQETVPAEDTVQAQAAPASVPPADAPKTEPANAAHAQDAAQGKPEGKTEEPATRLPTPLELLRASTSAQVITFPTANSAPAQDAAPEQPAAEDNGGEAPMNTVQTAANYTADMTVEEIIKVMTPDEAGAMVVNEGICKGWTLRQVAESRPASLRFYVHSNRSDNALKAAAKLLLDGAALKQAG